MLLAIFRPSCAALCAAIMLMLSSCAPISATTGNMVPTYLVDELRPGDSSKTDVLLKLGSPSSVSTFDDNIWYYIGQRTEQTAFFKPAVAEHQVLALSFDAGGHLDALMRVGKDKLREIAPIAKATPTAGKKLTILGQLVGNVGRFSGDGDSGKGRPTTPGSTPGRR
jgi:outer membrane protein assembly factor BamE (lipoprotein component of BamABCDE complex)